MTFVATAAGTQNINWYAFGSSQAILTIAAPTPSGIPVLNRWDYPVDSGFCALVEGPDPALFITVQSGSGGGERGELSKVGLSNKTWSFIKVLYQ